MAGNCTACLLLAGWHCWWLAMALPGYWLALLAGGWHAQGLLPVCLHKLESLLVVRKF